MNINRMKMNLLALVLLPFLCLSAVCNANSNIMTGSDIDMNQLDKRALQRIFLGLTTIVNEKNVAPCFLSTPESKNEFLKLLNRTSGQYHSYWSKRLFGGSGVPPVSFKSPEKVLAFVDNNSSAVCFIVNADSYR